jgi:hypothetical protein
MPEDERRIEYADYGGRAYYNWTNAAKYVGMTDTGFRRRVKKLKEESGIAVPLIRLPISQLNVYHDKRVLDVFRKSVRVGEEDKWEEELRRVIAKVNSEE